MYLNLKVIQYPILIICIIFVHLNSHLFYILLYKIPYPSIYNTVPIYVSNKAKTILKLLYYKNTISINLVLAESNTF